jgi:hypothetical protein
VFNATRIYYSKNQATQEGGALSDGGGIVVSWCEKIQDKKPSRERSLLRISFSPLFAPTFIRKSFGRDYSDRAQKYFPMTHASNRVTLSDLYQSDDLGVNKQVLKKSPRKK